MQFVFRPIIPHVLGLMSSYLETDSLSCPKEVINGVDGRNGTGNKKNPSTGHVSVLLKNLLL
jgi:hypothetical protein